MEQLGLGRIFKFQAPAMGRAASHQIRLPKALALNTSRDAASTALLGRTFQCLTTLKCDQFHQFLPKSPPLEQIAFMLSLQVLVKILSLIRPLKHWMSIVRSLWSIFFARLNNLSFLRTLPKLEKAKTKFPDLSSYTHKLDFKHLHQISRICTLLQMKKILI